MIGEMYALRGTAGGKTSPVGLLKGEKTFFCPPKASVGARNARGSQVSKYRAGRGKALAPDVIRAVVQTKTRGEAEKFGRVGVGESLPGESLHFTTVLGTVGDDRRKPPGTKSPPKVFKERFRLREPLQNRARKDEIEPVGPGEQLGVAGQEYGLLSDRFGKAFSGFDGKFG